MSQVSSRLRLALNLYCSGLKGSVEQKGLESQVFLREICKVDLLQSMNLSLAFVSALKQGVASLWPSPHRWELGLGPSVALPLCCCSRGFSSGICTQPCTCWMGYSDVCSKASSSALQKEICQSIWRPQAGAVVLLSCQIGKWRSPELNTVRMG